LTRPSLRPLTLGPLGLAVALLVGAAAARPLAAQYGPQLRGEGFGKNKVQYREFDWHIYHSPHFNVYYYTSEEALLQRVVSFAESAYDQLSRDFNHQIKDPIPLIFYATHSAFEQNNIILNFIPEGVGAFATPARFRMVLPVDLAEPQLMELILHELTHIFQYHLLFQGSLAKAVATSPPGWFMEGMASYMAKDESARDKMFLRDAVVNDQIPSITLSGTSFFAYRFGHAVFDFIEERWGKEGFLDFLYEMRNTLGARVDRAIERTFRLEAEEFDAEFRRWLRKKYLPELVRTGEPGDFGKLFRVKDERVTYETSPAASPSGDLVAAISTISGDTDVVLFDAEKRRYLRNLTKGFTNDYQYLVAQEQRLGRLTGRDLSFSPDGNTLAVFAKRERGRSLVLLDVLNGGVRQIIDMVDLEQQLSPSWSPDGRAITFSGWRGGQFDIFVLDVASLAITNLTNDPLFDGAPVYSPDGTSIVFTSSVGEKGFTKLFRIDLADPGRRYPLTSGDSNENDPVYSPDGKRVYFTSDRLAQIENIFSLDFASGETRQHTNVVTGAFMPTVLAEPDGEERLVYTGYWKGVFDLYVSDLDEPVAATPAQLSAEATPVGDIPRFQPDIDVTIDEANKERYGGYKFFLEDAETFVGVDDDQTLLGRVVFTFSDYLGDRRIITDLSSVESFSDFNLLYADLSKRLQWQVNVFDTRTYYIGQDAFGEIRRGRAAFEQTGAIASLVFPFSFYTRAELGAGYILRKFDAQSFAFDPVTGEPIPFIERVKDDFPLVTGALAGDSSIFAPWGAISGRRWRLDVSYAPDLDESGTLFNSVDLDIRQYIPVSRRSNFALRAFVGVSDGNRPSPFYFGGLDTVRGFRFRELVGDRAFFTNVEFRFPLIDFLATPVLGIQGVRGVLFFDVGGAWFDDFEDFEFYNSDESRLEDAVASYGWGISATLFGLPVNWDFAQQYDLKDRFEGFRTSFWVGYRF
jgi:Tol biopolymer transport system component